MISPVVGAANYAMNLLLSQRGIMSIKSTVPARINTRPALSSLARDGTAKFISGAPVIAARLVALA